MEGNLLAGKTVGIAGPVPFLVVVAGHVVGNLAVLYASWRMRGRARAGATGYDRRSGSERAAVPPAPMAAIRPSRDETPILR